jgi:hypothetical protein
MVQYAGQVVDTKGNPVFGAIVEIRDEHGDIQIARTDSTGRYQYTLRSISGFAHYKVSSDSYEPRPVQNSFLKKGYERPTD